MNDFDQLMRDIEAEAHAEGPAAVAQLHAFNSQFLFASDMIRLRKARGMTQALLAEASGVQQADISKIERGVVNPTIATVNKIAGALHGQLRMLPEAQAA